MTLEITAIGGYNEIGKQSTAFKVDEDVVIVDLGLHLDHYIKYTEDDKEDLHTTSIRGLRKAGAIPDWTTIKDWKNNIRAIILTHAHLDHIGAVPFIAPLFDCPIYGTPFTLAVLRQLIADREMELPNELIEVKKKMQITDKITLELIHITHSTQGTAVVALHTPHGVVVVDNDYKLDMHPTLGKPPDFASLERLQGKVIAQVSECLYAPKSAKTPSECVAKELLQEVLLESDMENRAVFVSTFSSHVARLNSIMEIGRAMGREVVFLGRSMAKYLAAAQEANILKVPDYVQVLKYRSQAKKFFRDNKQKMDRFLVVCTGHMGEPKAALSRIAAGEYPFKFKPGDVVVFSSSVIPVASIIANRNELERKLRDLHVRMFDEVHVSGHASREDIRKMLSLTQPVHVFPNHGVPEMTASFISLAREMGINPHNIHNLHVGDRKIIIQ